MDPKLLKESLDPFINIPKVELHAHLNGSLSRNTLEKLINLKTQKTHNVSNLDISSMISSKNLSECFKLFALIHDLTDNPEAIYMATCDVIKDFHEDGVCYLELRTTPKEEGCMNRDTYVEAVLKAINATVSELNNEISVKLILSIDRKRPIYSAEETVKIAEKYYTSSQSVVGVDLSGDPTTGKVENFIPFLEHAKNVGMKLAIHIAEILFQHDDLYIFFFLVSNCNEEVKELLKLQPHRLGHGTFLHPDKGGCAENFNILKELKAPLEICLTSNVICKTVPTYEDHHFQLFRKIGYPCVLCTDDKGVFSTSLSKEYYMASQYYSLSKEDLYDLSYDSIDYIFSVEPEKQDLRQLWKLKRHKVIPHTPIIG